MDVSEKHQEENIQEEARRKLLASFGLPEDATQADLEKAMEAEEVAVRKPHDTDTQELMHAMDRQDDKARIVEREEELLSDRFDSYQEESGEFFARIIHPDGKKEYLSKEDCELRLKNIPEILADESVSRKAKAAFRENYRMAEEVLKNWPVGKGENQDTNKDQDQDYDRDGRGSE